MTADVDHGRAPRRPSASCSPSACGVRLRRVRRRRRLQVRAELTRSFNLFPGSPVRVLGVDVGQHRRHRRARGGATVEVHHAHRRRRRPARPTPRAIVVPASLLGERYVQLAAYTEGPAHGGRHASSRSTAPACPYEFDEVLERARGLRRRPRGHRGRAGSSTTSPRSSTGRASSSGAPSTRPARPSACCEDNDDELIALAVPAGRPQRDPGLPRPASSPRSPGLRRPRAHRGRRPRQHRRRAHRPGRVTARARRAARGQRRAARARHRDADPGRPDRPAQPRQRVAAGARQRRAVPPRRTRHRPRAQHAAAAGPAVRARADR